MQDYRGNPNDVIESLESISSALIGERVYHVISFKTGDLRVFSQNPEPLRLGNAPPGEAPQKERSLMNIVLNSLDKDRVKSASVFI